MSPDIGDFLRQIPPFPIFILCASGLLLAVTFVLIVRARIQKAQESFTMPSRSGDFAYTPPAGQVTDLPDLDLLVGSPAPTSASQPPAHTPRQGTYSIRLNDGGSAEAVEVMTILRDVVDGGLIIQMGNKTYRDLASDEAFKTGFLKIMRELSPVVRGAAADAAESSAAPLPASPPSVREVINRPDPPRPAPRPAVSSGDSVPGALPSYRLEEQPLPVPGKKGLLGRGKLDLPPVPELNIAGRIEAYLQHKLLHTPEYAGRSIHVHPAEDGGVVIEVDGVYYEAVGDVADAEVRAFLTATIQEWQEHN